jgi:hypothetical protein
VLSKFGFGADGQPSGTAAAKPAEQFEPGSVLRKFGFTYDPGTVAKQPLPASMQPAPEKPATPAEAALAAERGVPAQIAGSVPVAGPALNWALAAGSAARPRVGETGSFQERLAARLEEQRRADAMWAEQNPATALAANVVGGAATLPVAAARLPFGLGETVGGRMYAGAAGGAAFNALDATLRGQDPTTAAIIGGIGGFLGPAVGEGAAGVARTAGNAVVPKGPLAGINRAGVNMLTNALEGETPASLAAARARMGPAGFVADTNTGLTDLAGGIADIPGGGKEVLREAYRTRAAEAGQRIDAAVTKAMGPPVNVVESEKNLTEARKAAADPLYQQWRDTQVQPTSELKSLMPRLEAAGAFDQAERLSGISGEPMNRKFFTGGPQKEFPTTQSWDYVKRGLDSKIDQAYAAGDKTLARSLVGLKGELVDEIEKTPAGDVWRRARQAFAEKSALIDQLAAGRDTFIGGRAGTTPDELREELRGLSQPELQARIQGARSAISDAMGDSIHGDNRLRDRLLASNNQAKLKMLIGNKPADELIASLQSERFLTAQDQNVRGGSQTTPKKERVNALMPSELPEYNPSLSQPLSWIPPSAREALRPTTIIEGSRAAQHEAARNALAPILVAPGQAVPNFLRAVLDEATRRAVVAQRAAKVGGAASALTGGAAPYIIRRETEARRARQ